MATTVHVPDCTLKRIDTIARRLGVSRNRLVVQALEEIIEHDAGEWPEGFFAPPDRSDDRALLETACRDLDTAIMERRCNRGALLL